MILQIPYGHSQCEVALPDGMEPERLEPRARPPLADPAAAIRNALQHPIGTPPLREIVHPGERVAIIVNDITRLVRTDLFLPVLVEELNGAGIPDRDLLVVFALGNHRPLTPEEQKTIVGEELSRRLKLVDHDCHNDLTHIGRTCRGNEIWVNRQVREADRVILTGEIIYHLIAGYSGGRKSLFPGVAGEEFIRFNHRFILEPGCRIGTLEGNPAHEDLLEACHLFAPDFLLNVVLSPTGDLLHVVAGHYEQAHRAGCKLVDEIYGIQVKEKYDAVIASAGGFPFDIDLRQAHKGMENAARALQDGGTLIYFAECRDGCGSRALKEWAERFTSPAELEAALRKDFVVGAHKTYWLQRLGDRFRIFLASKLDQDLVRKCHLHPVELHQWERRGLLPLGGKNARVAYIPCAGFTLPVLAGL